MIELIKKYWKIIVLILSVLLIVAAATQIHTFNVGDIITDKNPSPSVWYGFNVFFIVLAIACIGMIVIVYARENPEVVEAGRERLSSGLREIGAAGNAFSAQIRESLSDSMAASTGGIVSPPPSPVAGLDLSPPDLVPPEIEGFVSEQA